MPIRGKPPKRSPAVQMEADVCATSAYTDYLRASLIQLEQAVIDANKAGSWQAMSTLKLRALETRRLLDEEVAKASSPDESMSDEQLLSIIVQAVASMPPQHLERIEDAVELRRGGKVVRLAGGGGS
jgi:hypothetical protein